MLANPLKPTESISFEPSIINLLQTLDSGTKSWWVSQHLQNLVTPFIENSHKVQGWSQDASILPTDVVILDVKDALRLNYRYFYAKRLWVINQNESIFMSLKAMVWLYRLKHVRVQSYRVEPNFSYPVTFFEYDRDVLYQVLNRQTQSVNSKFAKIIRTIKIVIKSYTLRPNLWIIES